MKKKLLYIGTPIFGFNSHIISKMEDKGYEVDYFNDRPSENSLIKGIIKLKPDYLSKYNEKYFQEILNNCQEIDYDIIFVVNGKIFTESMINRMRTKFDRSKFVFYTWDSVKNYPNSIEIAKLFDKAYTFDLEDSKKYKELSFLPLFYSDGFKKIKRLPANYEYDILSVCTAHPNRYKVIKETFPLLERKGVRIFSFLYINKLQYLYNKLKAKEFKKAKKQEFSFEILPEDKYISKLEKSKAVFDVEHSNQTGLTIRTIETLGAKRKLITTNTTIKEYDFYNENNIFILTSNNSNEICLFLDKPFEEIDDSIYRKYSVESWVNNVIN